MEGHSGFPVSLCPFYLQHNTTMRGVDLYKQQVQLPREGGGVTLFMALPGANGLHVRIESPDVEFIR